MREGADLRQTTSGPSLPIVPHLTRLYHRPASILWQHCDPHCGRPLQQDAQITAKKNAATTYVSCLHGPPVNVVSDWRPAWPILLFQLITFLSANGLFRFHFASVYQLLLCFSRKGSFLPLRPSIHLSLPSDWASNVFSSHYDNRKTSIPQQLGWSFHNSYVFNPHFTCQRGSQSMRVLWL